MQARKLLDGATNFCGEVDEKIRTRIRAYLDEPTEAGWSDIAGIIITPSLRCGSLWQWVMVVDPTFPNTGPSYDRNFKQRARWKRIPDALLLARAIRAALDTKAPR
jgi:hypothetical protein